MRRLWMTTALLSLAAVFSACGDKDDDTTCATGETCECSAAGVCSWDCPDGGCDYVASGEGAATFTCDGGDCSLDASGQGDVTLTCSGGGCSVTGSGQGDLTVSCAGGTCDVTCSGQGQCTLSDCPDASCSIECTAVTAVCVEE